MKLWKKLALVLMSLTMCLGVASGCFGTGEESSSSQSSSVSTESSNSAESSSAAASSEAVSSDAESNSSEASSQTPNESESTATESESSVASSKSSEESESTGDAESESSSEETTDYVYQIRVQSTGGYGVRNVGVTLFDGETEIATVKTSTLGVATFTSEEVSTVGQYDVEITEFPAGWHLNNPDATYQTVATAQTSLTIELKPQLITGEAVPYGKIYNVGDVMYDFSVTLSDGNVWNLADQIAEKKMVMLNFWYVSCSYCILEFPAMHEALTDNAAKVGNLVVNIIDTHEESQAFKEQNGYDQFNVTAESSVQDWFYFTGAPTTVFIDRYGVVTYLHQGAMTEAKDFQERFDIFTKDDYKPTIFEENVSGGGSSGEDGTLEYAKPDVSLPDDNSVLGVLNAQTSGFTFSWESDDPYSWPWLVKSDNNGDYLYSSNKVDYSYSSINITFTAQAGQALVFDFFVSTEALNNTGDLAYVFVDGANVYQYNGLRDWFTCVAYVFEDGQAGEHTLSLLYLKDSTTSAGEDEVRIRNLRFMDKDELDVPTTDVDIFRYAAWGENTDLTADSDGVVRQYLHYAEVVYNEEDTYYHVGTKDGPYLFASFMLPTQWNVYDLYQLSYNDLTIVSGGINLAAIIENYAWAASHSRNGYVPVTEEIRTVLELLTGSEIYGEKSAVAYHDKEWLEMCVYYDHYGDTEPMLDPCRGVTYDGAIPLHRTDDGEELNHIVLDFTMVPVGHKYKYTVEQSGVYHIYTKGTQDPQFWVVAPDRSTFLTFEQDNLLAKEEMGSDGKKYTNTGNSETYVYMEAGQTYYFLFATWLNMEGEYDVALEYVGEEYSYLTNCAVGPYTYLDDAAAEIFLPDTIEYTFKDIDNDGVEEMIALNADGTEGSQVYLDFIRVTYLFPFDTLSDKVDESIEKVQAKDDNGNLLYDNNGDPVMVDKYAPEERIFYLDGVDYTQKMRTLRHQSKLVGTNSPTYGMTEVTKELYDILVKFTAKYDGFGGVTNSWQLLCYYYRPINSEWIAAFKDVDLTLKDYIHQQN